MLNGWAAAAASYVCCMLTLTELSLALQKFPKRFAGVYTKLLIFNLTQYEHGEHAAQQPVRLPWYALLVPDEITSALPPAQPHLSPTLSPPHTHVAPPCAVVYLDADTIAVRNMDELFLCDGLCGVLRHSERINTGARSRCRCRVGQPGPCLPKSTPTRSSADIMIACFSTFLVAACSPAVTPLDASNLRRFGAHAVLPACLLCFTTAGVLALTPSTELFNAMMASIGTTPSYTGGDQGFLNALFAGVTCLLRKHVVWSRPIFTGLGPLGCCRGSFCLPQASMASTKLSH